MRSTGRSWRRAVNVCRTAVSREIPWFATPMAWPCCWSVRCQRSSLARSIPSRTPDWNGMRAGIFLNLPSPGTSAYRWRNTCATFSAPAAAFCRRTGWRRTSLDNFSHARNRSEAGPAFTRRNEVTAQDASSRQPLGRCIGGLGTMPDAREASAALTGCVMSVISRDELKTWATKKPVQRTGSKCCERGWDSSYSLLLMVRAAPNRPRRLKPSRPSVTPPSGTLWLALASRGSVEAFSMAYSSLKSPF